MYVRVRAHPLKRWVKLIKSISGRQSRTFQCKVIIEDNYLH